MAIGITIITGLIAAFALLWAFRLSRMIWTGDYSRLLETRTRANAGTPSALTGNLLVAHFSQNPLDPSQETQQTIDELAEIRKRRRAS